MLTENCSCHPHQTPSPPCSWSIERQQTGATLLDGTQITPCLKAAGERLLGTNRALSFLLLSIKCLQEIALQLYFLNLCRQLKTKYNF